MILTEFDKDLKGIINPDDIETIQDNFPKIGVSWFSSNLMDRFIEIFSPEQIGVISNANGKIPVYKISYKAIDIAVYLSPIGAPGATVGYEEIIAKGLDKLVLFGTCGVLDENIEDTSIIVPTSAIRDEGTSYHYLPASDEVEINIKHMDMINRILDEHGYSHTKGKTWTTDAPYRETKAKMEKRKQQGCVSVEMECASMAAVAQFRNKELIHFFHAADNLAGSKWDKRSLGSNMYLSEKEKIMLLAFELAINL